MFELSIEKEQLNMGKLLATGQVFRYIELEEKRWVLMYGRHHVVVEEMEYGYLFHCEEEEMSVWQDYLCLHMDYVKLNDRVVGIEDRLEEAIREFEGIRIMHQDSFEMLLTFIISQSKSIVQIRKLVNVLSESFGDHLGQVEGHDIYSFPRPEQLSHLTEQDLREMKFGYRSPYLVDAVRVFGEEGETWAELSTDQLMDRLLTVHGVGRKVASCVLLFGYNRYEVFPVDVWMRRIMESMYDARIRQGLENPNVKRLSDKHIETFGLSLFGDIAGIAQQYLFEYRRQIM